MNDEMLEELVRTGLQQRASRDVPQALVQRADAIPSANPAAPTARVRAPRTASRWFAVIAAAAIVVVIVAGIVLVPAITPPSPVGAPPVPTRPPVTQPSLPPGAEAPTELATGAWISANAAWVANAESLLWLTTDGGQTWAGPRPLPHPLDELRGGPTFIDASTAYAIWTTAPGATVEVSVDVTGDGGATWSSRVVGSLPSSADQKVSATAHFSDRVHGVALATSYLVTTAPPDHAGAGLIPASECRGWSTDDGGAAWRPLEFAACSDHDVWASPLVGVLMPEADGGASVATTVDGGRSWRVGMLPDVTSQDVPWSVTFTLAPDGSPRLAYWVRTAADAASPARIIVAESADNGLTWEKAYEFEPPADLALDSVSALSPDHWIGTGLTARFSSSPSLPDVPVFETGDAGRTWHETGTMGSIDGRAFGWADRLHAMATGQDDSGCELQSGTPCHADGFFLTNDGGKTWHGVPF